MAERTFDIEELMRQQGATDPFQGGVSTSMPVGAPVAAETPAPAEAAAPVLGNSRDERAKLGWGNTGTMSGFRVGYDYGGDAKAANSVKNTFGRLASNYANTPEGLRQLVGSEEFKRYFPNAKLLDGGAGDKIDFGGVLSDFESGSPVGVVDVGQAFDPTANSGAAWAWMPDGGGDPAGGGPGGGQFMDLASILAGQDPLNDILKRVQDIQNGQTPSAEQNALINMLTGEAR